MNAFAEFPTTLHWTADELASAVPLRLSELPLFAADAQPGPACAANARRRHAHALAASRLPASALPSQVRVG